MKNKLSTTIKRYTKKYKWFNLLAWIIFYLYKLSNVTFSIFHNKFVLFKNYFSRDKYIKIVFVGPIHSFHFQHFKKQLDNNFFKDKNLLFMYVNSYVSESTSSFSKDLILDRGIYTFLGYLPFSLEQKRWINDLYLNATHNLNPLNKKFIFNQIKKFKPDYLWIHDAQSGGYLVDSFLYNLKEINPSCKNILSIWGNDLYFFYQHNNHKKKLRLLLKNIHFLHGECSRDEKIARSLGFEGKTLPPCSITMTDIDHFYNLSRHNKKIKKDFYVCVKGSYYLRSNINYFFDDIRNNLSFWKDKKIVCIGTTEEDNFYIEKLNSMLAENIEYHDWMTFDEYMDYLSRSKYHLTCNLSDGILNSAAESAFLNCLPIFSRDTGLCEFLDQKLIEDITYDFNRLSFMDLFQKLDNGDINIEEHLLSIQKVYESHVYNYDIYKNIFKILEQARR